MLVNARSIEGVECVLVFVVRKSPHSVNKEIHILFLFLFLFTYYFFPAKSTILWSREGTMMDKCTALANSQYPLWNKHGSGHWKFSLQHNYLLAGVKVSFSPKLYRVIEIVEKIMVETYCYSNE